MLPKKLRIAYRDYRVKYNERKKKFYGSCDPKEALIKIFYHKDSPAVANTLLHEVGHALFFESGLDSRIEEKYEEDIVRSLTDGLCKFFVDNPETAQWLLDSLINKDVEHGSERT